MHLENSDSNKERFENFKSDLSPPQEKYLIPFENDLFGMVYYI